MGMVTVRFWGTLRFPGQRTLQVEVAPQGTLGDVVNQIAAQLGGDVDGNVKDILSFCMFVRNGDQVPPELELETPVEEGDILAFVPAVSGGSR